MTPRAISALAAALFACGLALPHAIAAPITIGPGPALGVERAGVTWHEEFQD